MNTPHATWAEAYDYLYEKTPGNSYQRLTALTVQQIVAVTKPPARIVDFGAGTGRIALPLADRGYDVTAVEPCREMLVQLAKKPGAEKVIQIQVSMQDFRTQKPFDFATCVFTVLLYLLDEEALDKSLQAAADALKSGGFLLIDIPTEELFGCPAPVDTAGFRRTVTVSPQGNDLYRYREDAEIYTGPLAGSYTDEFSIRYWPRDKVMGVLQKHGFALEKDLSSIFPRIGAEYVLMRKSK